MLKTLTLAIIATFFLSACLAPIETPTPSGSADPLSAVVGEITGNVNGKPSAVETLAPINLGFTLRTGGQVQTGDASKARLDFSDRTILRVAANSAYTLEGVQTQANGNVLAQIELSFGRLWVSLTGGELQVRTPVAVASVRGSFAIFVYEPGDPNNPDDDLLVIDCLEGSCTAVSPSLNEQLGNLERLVISPQGSLKQLLTPQDVQAFVLENPESGHLVATLTAAPPATATPADGTAVRLSETPSVSPFTLTPASVAPVAASDTPAVSAPGATATIGTHTVRAGETLNCIGRGYGVLPEAIATSNKIAVNAQLNVGNPLLIPRVQWTNISPGPVCQPQFASPFPGLSFVTATRAPAGASATPTRTPAGTGTLAPQISFTADATTLAPGQCTNLRWTTANVKEVFLNGQGVVGNSVQQVCPPQTTTYTLTVNTGATTETRTVTITVTGPTATNTPPSDTQGPTILRAVVNPTQIGSRGPTGCNLTFTAEITDQSPIAFAEVQWTAFDLQGLQVGSGSGTMQFVSGNTYRHDWLNITLSSLYGSIVWKVNTADIFDNVTNVSGTPNVVDVPTSLGGCGSS